MYYPKVKVDACLSSPAHDAPSDFQIDQMTSYLKQVDHHSQGQMNRLNGMINQIDWMDPSVRAKFRNKAKLSGFDNQCFYKGKKVTHLATRGIFKIVNKFKAFWYKLKSFIWSLFWDYKDMAKPMVY